MASDITLYDNLGNPVVVNGEQVKPLSTGGVFLVGEIKSSFSTVVPTGFLATDGSAISRTTYADLFNAIGDSFGVGDGVTTFNLPDTRGQFLRGFADGVGDDSARIWGVSQEDTLQGHKHYIAGAPDDGTADAGSSSTNGSNAFRTDDIGDYDRYVGAPITDGVNGTPRTSIETRPKNITVKYYIKY